MIAEKINLYQIWMYFKYRFTFERPGISRTEQWRTITLTFPSRNSVLMQPIIGYPAPELSVACYPH